MNYFSVWQILNNIFLLTWKCDPQAAAGPTVRCCLCPAFWLFLPLFSGYWDAAGLRPSQSMEGHFRPGNCWEDPVLMASETANPGSSFWLLLCTVCLQFDHLSHFTYLNWKKGLCKHLLLIPWHVFLPLVPSLPLLPVISYCNSTKMCQIRWMLLSSSEVMFHSNSIQNVTLNNHWCTIMGKGIQFYLQHFNGVL